MESNLSKDGESEFKKKLSIQCADSILNDEDSHKQGENSPQQYENSLKSDEKSLLCRRNSPQLSNHSSNEHMMDDDNNEKHNTCNDDGTDDMIANLEPLVQDNGITQNKQWLQLSIIGNIIHRYYNSSIPGTGHQQQMAIDWLSMVFMLAYVILVFPAAWLLSHKGIRVTVVLGAAINMLGAWIKCASVDRGRFWTLMLAQTVTSTAGALILGVPSRIAAVWFGPNEVSTATSLGVFGSQLGDASGFLIPPMVVKNDENINVVGDYLRHMFWGTAAVTSLVFLLVIIVYRASPPHPPSQARAHVVASDNQSTHIQSIVKMLKHPGFVLLMIAYGINTGCYVAIATLLNPIIIGQFEGEEVNAGRIGLTIVLSGLIGSIVAGVWLDKTKIYKWTTVGINFLSMISMIVFTVVLLYSGRIWAVFMAAFLLGFFMTGYIPVGYEFAVEITYPEPEGTSAGILNFSAQIFGVLLTLLMSALMTKVSTLVACLTLASALLVGTILTLLIQSELKRQKVEQIYKDTGELENLNLNTHHHPTIHESHA
ncbi:unnamed protein product [Owenia fusiformis]|uniref:Major facilitator superfamily (MFS) profile domain-containing protein n=1 Tax=Owenia fusiformis TaxID=6347 RepID=A0A8S4PZ07_OWEFU|nr:unnamed protein product [Owenia fusiformis]